MPAVEPKRFGQYVLISEIARGTYGRLWTACRRLDSGETEAVLIRRLQKRSPLELPALEEIRSAVSLSEAIEHERFARLTGIEETEDELGVVFEYVDGKDLKSLLGIAPLKHMKTPPGVGVHIAASALEGLVTLQQKLPEELATPALWPDCVFVAADGTTRLLDPGVSAAIARVVGPKKYPQLVGYSSPEEFGDDDERKNSDVFRAGVLLWEMLAAKRLYTGGTTNTTVDQVQHAPIPPLEDLAASCPGLLEVVNRALAHDRAERFASVEELVSALESSGVVRASDAEVAAFLGELVGTGLAAQGRAVAIALERVAQVDEKDASGPAAAPAPSPPAPKGATKTVVSEVAPLPTRQETLLGVPPPALLGVKPLPPPPPPKRPPQPMVAGAVVAGTSPLDLTPIDDLESPLPSHPKTERTENSALALLETLEASDIEPVSGPAEALSDSDLLVADDAPPAPAVLEETELANELDSIAPPREPRFKRKHVIAAAAALALLLLSVGVLAVIGRGSKTETADTAATGSALAAAVTDTAPAPAPATVAPPAASESAAAPVESAAPPESDAAAEAPVAAKAPAPKPVSKAFVSGKPKPKVKPKAKTTTKSKTLAKPKSKTATKGVKKPTTTKKKPTTKKPIAKKTTKKK
jgi:serine/threonine-protein kinase